MGSDGTLGLQAIHSQGGLTLAQQPDSAAFDAMPRSAIAVGCVAFVGSPAALAQRIVAHAGGDANEPVPAPAIAAVAGSPTPAQALAAILKGLREHSRHDLSLYKASTLLRRIERRIGVHGLGGLGDYLDFLRHNPQEFDLLFKEMLIGVTSFFRDPPAWAELRQTVLPDLLDRHLASDQAAGPLRAWVAGCSTGEEAYSLVMLFCELVDTRPEAAHCRLQIFATDLSADAIAFARRGIFPLSAAASLGPERVERFFTRVPGGLLVKPAIRERILFALHDLILDPPFTRLDFLSCRNLLIYFNASLQRRLMPLFHYGLRSGGVLLLGDSETVGRSHALFVPMGARSRLYRRSDNVAIDRSVDFPLPMRVPPRASVQEFIVSQPPTNLANLQSLADQLVLRDFSPSAAMVNATGDIVYISGRTGRYLEPAAGKANWNIHVMARPGLRTQVAAALRVAREERSTVQLHGLVLEDEAPQAVDVTVRAILEPAALDGLYMIVFRDVPATPRARRRAPPGATDELARARDEVTALRQEMAASAEELQAAIEELQSTNEELQSTNEELTTSKEEAQSMNEELQTINGELQSKLDDLALAQSDMANLLNSTDIATLFLDSGLCVRRYTERVVRIFHLREGDVGRPLTDLASTLVYPELHEDAQQTLRTLAVCEKQIATQDGLWYAVRIMPYRTLANVIQGVVITFVDITAAKSLETQLRKT
jgi:two-component system CheB/CheR fusion protein